MRLESNSASRVGACSFANNEIGPAPVAKPRFLEDLAGSANVACAALEAASLSIEAVMARFGVKNEYGEPCVPLEYAASEAGEVQSGMDKVSELARFVRGACDTLERRL